MVKKLGLLFLVTIMLSSCVSTKKIHYFQGSGNNGSANTESKNYETIIKSDDLLMIVVSASNMESVEKFNLSNTSVTGATAGSVDQVGGQMRVQTYLVDKNGEINFPVLGTVKVAGLTKLQVVQNFKERISEYVNDPIINLRIVNYKVSVIGEVARPGEIALVSERITILEALSMAGDMTIYGDRKSVTLIRETDGVKSFYELDLTDAGIIQSPYYYLQQNDVLYVKQNKVRSNSAGVGPNTSVMISAASLLLATLAIILR
jgi:polysaccharide export outer membrane protein